MLTETSVERARREEIYPMTTQKQAARDEGNPKYIK